MAAKYSTDISAERLRELLNYCPETGLFRWIKTTSFRAKIGGIAGHLHSSGYVTIRIDTRSYRAHRLAWLYVTSEFPEKDIDHQDGNRSNNAFANLREATRSDNMQNLHVVPCHNITGLIGAHRIKNTNMFRSKIVIGKKTTYLGKFGTAEEASSAYLAAKAELHPFSSHPTPPLPQELPNEAKHF